MSSILQIIRLKIVKCLKNIKIYCYDVLYRFTFVIYTLEEQIDMLKKLVQLRNKNVKRSELTQITISLLYNIFGYDIFFI